MGSWAHLYTIFFSVALLVAYFFLAKPVEAVSWKRVYASSFESTYIKINPSRTNEIFASVRIPGDFDLIKSTDSGQTWYSIKNSLSGLDANWISIPNNNPDIIAISLWGSGIHISLDSGVSWSKIFDAQFPRSVEIDPLNSNIIFVGIGGNNSGQSGLYKSINGGTSWVKMPLGDSNNSQITIDKNNSNRIFADSDPNFFRTINGGLSWDLLSISNVYSGGTTVDNDNTSIIYAGRLGPNPGVYKSNDGGNSWVWENNGFTGGPFHISQDSNGTLVVTRINQGGGGIWKSTDRAESWQNVSDILWGTRNTWGLDIKDGKTFVGVSDLGIYYADLNEAAAPEPNPVVFIPGFTGSWSYRGLIENQPTTYHDWTLFPVLSDFAYKPLLLTLEAAGLEKDEKLFTFAYDYRKSVSVSSQELNIFLANEVVPKNPGQKVNLIGHSMGGLVARYCYDKVLGCSDKINKIVTGGSPHQGTLAAYLAWEGGVIDDNNPTTRNLFEITLRALYPGNLTRKDIVQKHLPAIRDFLPIFNYLSGKPYANMSTFGKNPLLELNPPTDGFKSLTHGYVGNGPQTYLTFNTTQPKVWEKLLGLWVDGKPVGNTKAIGDGTVLKVSAEIPGAVNSYYDIEHAKFFATEQPLQDTLSYFDLTGSPVLTPGTAPNSLLSFILHSPATITVRDEAGQIVGSRLDEKGVFIANPVNQTYTVEVIGVSEGKYSLDAVFSGATNDFDSLSGQIRPDQVKIHRFRFLGNSRSMYVDPDGDNYYQSFLISLEGISNSKINFLRRVVELAMSDIQNNRGRGAALINLETAYLNLEDIISTEGDSNLRGRFENASEALLNLNTQMNSLYGKLPSQTVTNSNLKKAQNFAARLAGNQNPPELQALNTSRAFQIILTASKKGAEGDWFTANLLARGVLLL